MPGRGRVSSRFWMPGSGGRLAVRDSGASGDALKIAFDPCDGLRPFEVGVTEGERGRIMPTADFLLELPSGHEALKLPTRGAAVIFFSGLRMQDPVTAGPRR